MGEFTLKQDASKRAFLKEISKNTGAKKGVTEIESKKPCTTVVPNRCGENEHLD